MNERRNASPTRRGSRRARPTSLVWLDAREAFILRPEGERVVVAHLESDVPARRRSTGHLRHDPTLRHGGGLGQACAEHQRAEHLERYLQQVAERLAPGDDLVVIGPGTVRDHLVRRLADRDAAHHAARLVVAQRVAHQTVPQLVARLKQLTGQEPPRWIARRRGWLDDSRVPAHAGVR